jgi:hypothetical protein
MQSPLCQGPCRQDCFCHPYVQVAATLAIVYTLTSILYLVFTRDIGTPFKDSLNEEQKRIKEASATVRKDIFLKSLFASSALVLVCGRYLLPSLGLDEP